MPLAIDRPGNLGDFMLRVEVKFTELLTIRKGWPTWYEHRYKPNYYDKLQSHAERFWREGKSATKCAKHWLDKDFPDEVPS